MFLKRSLVLAAGVVLFVVAFIVYFDVSHAQMENRFKAEREKFGVEGVALTAAEPAASTATPSVDTTAPSSTNVAPDTNNPASSAPASVNSTTPDSTTAPASSDTNAAPATPAPDTNAAPVPATSPDTNSAPAAAPSSTMDYPASGRSPFFQLASYRPFDHAAVQIESVVLGQVSAAPAPAAASPTTNPAPATLSAPAAPNPFANFAGTPSSKTGTNSSSTGQAAPATNSSAPHSTTGDGKVIVLLYHQFKAAGVPIPAKFQWTMNVDVFESEMKYIHDNGYQVISMADLLKFLKHQITLPPNCVCITIDDGYKSALVYAAPILKKYGYPWTFFVYPDFITVGEGPGAASWKDLLDLQAQGIDIECHSMTHPNLKLHHQKVKGVWHNFTPDEYAAWLNNETAGAKALLEQKMGRPITVFAYPYGEYNQQVEDAVIAAGFEAIFTVADNPVHATTNLHSIGRYTITQGVEKNFTAYLRQGALELTSADPAPGATITNPRPVITATLGYPGKLDPKSLETMVRDYGDVRHDFDPQTNTVRLYLPRDLIASVALVNIRIKDASSGQYLVANWHFNYEPAGGPATPAHAPMAPATNAPPASPQPTASATTNVPAATTDPEPLEKNAVGTPMDSHPAPVPPTTQASPHESTNSVPQRD